MGKEKRFGRRKFVGILGGLAVAAGASGVLWEVLRPKVEPELELKPARQVRPNAYTENGRSLVSIVGGNSDTEIETMVRSAVGAIGGMGKIVSTGKTVVVKPAVAYSGPNYSPDPRVVAAVAKLAKEAGGTVVVAESSANQATKYNLSSLGITSAAEEVGAEVRDLQTEEPLLMEVPEGVSLHEVETYPTIYDCDVLISVPRLKRSGACHVTLSLKNMMGTITKDQMNRFHNIDLSQCIADLSTVIKPDLAVVDATYAGVGERGRFIEMNTIMASGDPVANDRIAAQKLYELELREGIESYYFLDGTCNIRHINAAADLGVGTNDSDNIKIIEEVLS